VIEAGRRSGKTEIAKRHGVRDALLSCEFDDFLVAFLAPTRDQARSIFWEDLKKLSPRWFISYISESHLEIHYVNGATVAVVGMDKPARVEGRPIDRVYCDEMAEMKLGVWDRNLRPALSTPGRPGRGWFFGVPRPSIEFSELARRAQDDTTGEYAYFKWSSKGIVEDSEIESARAGMDPLTFAQEYEAERVSMQGRAYYGFDRVVHARSNEPFVDTTNGYRPDAPLVFCFDFNVEPGTAVICQERRFREHPGDRSDRPEVADQVTVVLDEVWIPRDSNTPSVCRALLAKWGQHAGPVYCYGDPAGGARTTVVEGNNWAVIRQYLSPVYEKRLSLRWEGTEQAQRPRVNALNTRLRTADGKVHLLLNPKTCPNTVRDFENTAIKTGTAGELDKPVGTPFTHLTDALGYYCLRAHPITGVGAKSELLRL